MSTEELDSSWGEEESALWAAGFEEAPRAGAETALLSALGLGGPPAGPDGGVPHPPEAAPLSGVSAQPLSTSSLFKWSTLGALVVGAPIVWFAVSASDEVAPSAAPVERGAIERAVKAPLPAPKEMPSVATVPSMPPEIGSTSAAARRLPPAPVGGDVASKSVTEPASVPAIVLDESPVAEPSLREEIAYLKRVSGLVAQKDWAHAEPLLNAYPRDFPKQRLAAEARVLRVEMLVARGKKDEARTVAAPLLGTDSPYRARLLALLGGS